LFKRIKRGLSHPTVCVVSVLRRQSTATKEPKDNLIGQIVVRKCGKVGCRVKYMPMYNTMLERGQMRLIDDKMDELFLEFC